MSYEKYDFNKEKEIIAEEARLEKARKKQLFNELVEATTYKKGEITKEVFKLPMPTDKSFLSDKNVNVKTYGAIILESNWGGTFLNPTDRYLYKDKWNEAIKKASQELKISESTIKRHINKLKNCNIKAIELTNVNGKLVYKLNYSTFNQNTGKKSNYVTLTNVALRKLVNAHSEYSMRIYLFLLYKCHFGEKLIKQNEICEAIGISPKSRKIVTDCIEALEYCGFISVSVDFKIHEKTNEDGKIIEHTIPNYYYSLSDRYLESKKYPRKK